MGHDRRAPELDDAIGEVEHLRRDAGHLREDQHGRALALAVHVAVFPANVNVSFSYPLRDMRKITAWVAIAAVPTMIVGIYGMNFDHMPELRVRGAIPALPTGMFVICYMMYRRFKQSDWS